MLHSLLLHLSVGLSFACSPSPAPAADASRLVRASPAESVAWLGLSDLDGLRAQGKQNAWFQMLHDAEFDPMWGWFHEQMGEGDLPEGLDPLAILDSIHGSTAIFVTPAAEGSDQPLGAIGVLIEPGKDRAAYDAHVAKIIAAIEKDATRSSDSYAGVQLTLFETQDDPPDGPQLLVYSEADGLSSWVFGASRESALSAAHGVLDRAKGQAAGAGIAANPQFAAARQSAGDPTRPARIEGFVDLATLIELAQLEDPPDADDQKLMDTLGVQEMRWAYASCDIGEGESMSMRFALSLPQKGALARWLECLKPISRDFAKVMPRDSASISLFHLDIWGLWESIWATMSQIDPEKTKKHRDEFTAMQQSMGGLDLEGDLLKQLTGDIAAFEVKVPDEEWKAALGELVEAGDEAEQKLAGVPRIGQAWVIGVRDAEAIEGFLDTVLGMIGMQEALDTDEIEGHPVTQLALPTGATLSWCFDAQRAIFSNYPTALRAALAQVRKPDAGSALDSPRFKPYIESNKDACGLTLAGSAETAKSALGGFAMLGSIAGGGGSPDSDFPPTPAPEVADRYLKGTLVWAMVHKAGLLEIELSAR